MEIRLEINGVVINITVPEAAQESTALQVQCPDCGWTKSYPDPKMAKRGLAAHSAHCPGPTEEMSRLRRIMGFEGNDSD